jgi:hypothetical protein
MSSPGPSTSRATNYFKKALLNHWNLLGLVGAGGAALLSGIPLVTVPLVLAAELVTVVLLATHPKFQRYVDAQEAAEKRKANRQNSSQTLQQILKALPQSTLTQFQKLQNRCLELRQIANDLKHGGDGAVFPLDDAQLEALDKLLWIYLRLLYTQHALGKFLERANYQQMTADVKQVETRLKELDPQDQSVHAQKMRRTLEDHLKTAQDRLENFAKAEANYELVGLEVKRLESKISTLAELAVNRQEPDFIASQVDQVAGSMLDMEKTMNDLQFATGLAPLDEDVPTFLQSPLQKVKN